MDQTRRNTNSLVFALNGQRFELSVVDPSTTLLDFLRNQTPFKSAKLGCGEGGCGACVVLLSKFDPLLNRIENYTASSCLTLLCSLNGCSITTSEGLGNSQKGFHSIHKRFTGFHASQCGFCTPGMCMSLFGALVNAETTDRSNPSPGFSKLTAAEAEKSIAGNLCRCTGYRPIADACKSFAADVDIEDLGLNSFWSKRDEKEVKVSRLPEYNNNDICTFPEFLKTEVISSLHLDFGKSSWHQPCSFEELDSLLGVSDGDNGLLTKLVVGNTSVGYYKEYEQYNKYIDLRYIPELSVIQKDHRGIEVGAAVTISKVIEALREEDEDEKVSENTLVFKKIADHMDKIGSRYVRNVGSIGGNLVMAQRKHFPSDIATILLGAGSFVTIKTGTVYETVTLEEFLEGPPLDLKSVLLNAKIPNHGSMNGLSPGQESKFLFETYRAAPRPLGNALPYVNASFLAEVSGSKSSGGIVLNRCQLAFGSFGCKHAIRARKAEKFLSGKMLTISVLYEAITLVKSTVVPEDGTQNAPYRSSLIAGFLFSFLGPLIHSISHFGKLDHVKLSTLLSSSKQVIPINQEYGPVGEPITKSGASIQASGEAVYVDDIPSPINCLHGSFIYSTKPYARVKSITVPDGVAGLISFRDIPKGGENIGAMFAFGPDPLFAEDLALFAGDRLAFVLADSQKLADRASDLAIVDYDTENLELPILTLEQAVAKSSFFEIVPFIRPQQVGDASKGMSRAEHKIVSAEIKLGSQYHFCMENQTALAVPDEDNCIVVYSSVQCPQLAHATIARCLGIPENNVRVVTRRVGGGFGGKAMKAMSVATACALSAYKLQRPVRTYLNRKTDMIMGGGRHPMEITYSVGFNSNGKITALQLDILINAGITIDVSPIIPKGIISTLSKYDWGALSFEMKLCKTNLTSKTAMRAPGEVQGSYIAEAIIENVAATLSMDADSVRTINLHSYDSLKLFYNNSAGEPLEYTLTSIWDKIDASSSFNQRIEMVNEFNSCSVWKKRGISRIPIVFDVFVRPTPGKVSILSDGSIVVEVGGIELGQGLWTKVKQTAAFALSSVKCEGAEELLDKIRVIQNDTLSLTQGGYTAGSSTSESSCEAVRLSCNVLVERLNPLKERMQAQLGSIGWEQLVGQAYMEAVHLSSNSHFVPDLASQKYLNYGAAVCEVEIDILTGETTILRCDILYDCGRSLNPAVDLGQIEGAFVQGIGFFMLEEYTTNKDGLVDSNSTWSYKIPTIDTIPKQFNVEILNSGHHQNRVLSSKASGEPPVLLAASVHCAARAAIREARKQLHSWGYLNGSYATFDVGVPATMPVVKELCGMDTVERYLQWKMASV